MGSRRSGTTLADLLERWLRVAKIDVAAPPMLGEDDARGSNRACLTTRHPPLNAAEDFRSRRRSRPRWRRCTRRPTYAPIDRRVIVISALAIGVGAVAALIANVLTHLIGFITNLAYYGRVSWRVQRAEHGALGRVVGARADRRARSSSDSWRGTARRRFAATAFLK